jgi:organic hydroperoxide reductase OsmC/OhrA
MAQVRARVFEFGVSLDESWTATSDRDGPALANEPATWTPEHLVLAAVARCSLTSLAYHAKRAGVEVASRAAVRGTVTARPDDGRFAFVEITVDAQVTLDAGALDSDGVRDLVTKAERDCFVGASLTAKPQYRWTVNEEEIS